MILNFIRYFRVYCKILLGKEPYVKSKKTHSIKFYGNRDYGGWGVPLNFLNSNSCVVDIGLGEDISFSESLIAEYNLVVNGFDPTPKSIKYIEDKEIRNFKLYKFGLGAINEIVDFYLPNNDAHVSGSIKSSAHLGHKKIKVQLIDIKTILEKIDREKIDLLKIDIEGAEYEVLSSLIFQEISKKIAIICIEFHHRWPEFGIQSTKAAANILESIGFVCVWKSRSSNEEFTFINKNII